MYLTLQQAVAEYARQPGDTGSPEVQIAVMTVRLQQLTEHMSTHRKDLHSRSVILSCVDGRGTR